MSDQNQSVIDDLEWVEDAAADCPMLAEPHPEAMGDAQTLSPFEYLAHTEQPRRDLDGLPDTFGLYREDLKTIGKDGLQVFNRKFSSPDMRAYTTGPGKESPREFVIFYDRALASSYRLREVLLYEKLEDGSLVYRVTLQPGKAVESQLSRENLHRERQRYLASLKAKRGRLEEKYQQLHGTDKVEEMIDAAIERQARPALREEPRPAHPIYAGPEEEHPDTALGSALEGAPVEAVPVEPDEETEKPSVSDHLPEDSVGEESSEDDDSSRWSRLATALEESLDNDQNDTEVEED